MPVLFDGLELLTTEFPISNSRLDTIAFDRNKNTFVIIEYKNVKNKWAQGQALTYSNSVRDNKERFVLLYNKKKKKQCGVADFCWDKVYAILISSEFTKQQIATSNIPSVQLFQVRQYQSNLLFLERIGGEIKEGGRSAPPSKPKPVKSRVRSGAYDEEAYLNGEYRGGGASEETRKLYEKIKEKIFEAFDDLCMRQNKTYVGFYLRENDRCVCTLNVQKSKIVLTYSVKSATKLLRPSSFIRDVTGIGANARGDYRSEIKTESDLKKAMPFVRKAYGHHKKD